MAYVKTTWNDGDIITKEKLNNLENGVEEVSTKSEIKLKKLTFHEGTAMTVELTDNTTYQAEYDVD